MCPVFAALKVVPLTTFVLVEFQFRPPIASTPAQKGVGENWPSQLLKTIEFRLCAKQTSPVPPTTTRMEQPSTFDHAFIAAVMSSSTCGFGAPSILTVKTTGSPSSGSNHLTGGLAM